MRDQAARRIRAHRDADLVDARLPQHQRLLDPMPRKRQRVRIDGLEHQCAQPGAEVGPHHPLAGLGVEDDDRSPGARPPRIRPSRPRRRQLRPAGNAKPRPRNAFASLVGVELRFSRACHPISTFEDPTTIVAPQPTESPMRAAGWPR